MVLIVRDSGIPSQLVGDSNGIIVRDGDPNGTYSTGQSGIPSQLVGDSNGTDSTEQSGIPSQLVGDLYLLMLRQLTARPGPWCVLT